MSKQETLPLFSGVSATLLAVFYGVCGIPGAQGYAFNEIVPDVRQPASVSGGSACPVSSHDLIAPGAIAEQWSTVLGTNPVPWLHLPRPRRSPHRRTRTTSSR